jgi:hypothetical protein
LGERPVNKTLLAMIQMETQAIRTTIGNNAVVPQRVNGKWNVREN